MSIVGEIGELLRQRVEIDAQLAKLKEQAMKELEAAKANVEALDAVLKPVAMRAERQASPPQPIDETDAGNGVREQQENVSAASFKDELAMLRERTQEKRRRLG